MDSLPTSYMGLPLLVRYKAKSIETVLLEMTTRKLIWWKKIVSFQRRTSYFSKKYSLQCNNLLYVYFPMVTSVVKRIGKFIYLKKKNVGRLRKWRKVPFGMLQVFVPPLNMVDWLKKIIIDLCVCAKRMVNQLIILFFIMRWLGSLGRWFSLWLGFFRLC